MKFSLAVVSVLVIGSTSFLLRHHMKQRQLLLVQIENLQRRHQVLREGRLIPAVVHKHVLCIIPVQSCKMGADEC